MMIEIQKEPLWLSEAFFALEREEDRDIGRIMSHPEKFGMPKAEIEELFMPYQSYQKAVLPKLQELLKQNEVLCFYLGEKGGEKKEKPEESCYVLLQAAAVVLTDEVYLDRVCAGYLEEGKRQFFISRIISWVLRLSAEEEAEYQESAECPFQMISSITELMNLLKEADLSAEWKYRLLYLYLNQEEFLQEFQKTAEAMVSVLKQHFGLIQEQYEQMRQATDEEVLRSLLENGSSGLKLSLTDVFRIHLSIFRYNMISFYEWSGESGQEQVLMEFGMFVQKLISGKQSKSLLDSSELQSVGKALGDTSRCRILKLILGKGRMYLQELSREVGLTPATISHHLSALMDADLLQMEVSETEKKIIYYRINREQLERIGETFLQMAMEVKEAKEVI